MTKLRIRIRRNRVAKSAEAMRRERNLAACAFVFTLILSATSVCAQLVPGSMDVRWDAGAPDCKANPQPPIQVHRYAPETFFLRQNLCVSFEGNFLYLLIGSHKALLIDSGAIRDPARMPVAKTVLDLLPARDDFKMPLLVVHTHGHTDHRDGDAQFASLANVQVAPYDLMGVQKFFGFPSSPMAWRTSIWANAWWT